MATKERTLFSVESTDDMIPPGKYQYRVFQPSGPGERGVWTWSYQARSHEILCAEDFATIGEALADLQEYDAEQVEASQRQLVSA